jgi:16S rRNA (adenine1518-N6/adenine1519-N6)-dimethyltransferase
MNYTLKKSLGQHFLINENVCLKIVEALKKNEFTRLLEVGPGGGALTKYLLKIDNVDFKAIELDEEKVDYLLKTYPALQNKIIHKSILETEVPFEDDFILIGNFPYNISTQIVFKVLDWREKIPVLIGMFQKEVAERIASKPGSKVYGITSVLTQAFYNVEYLFDVAPDCFNPPPKVVSGVIQLTRKTEIPEMKSQKAFFNLVKMAFNQRRKTLRNATKSLFPEDVIQEDIFNKRAEQLTVQDFANLSFKLK